MPKRHPLQLPNGPGLMLVEFNRFRQVYNSTNLRETALSILREMSCDTSDESKIDDLLRRNDVKFTLLDDASHVPPGTMVEFLARRKAYWQLQILEPGLERPWSEDLARLIHPNRRGRLRAPESAVDSSC